MERKTAFALASGIVLGVVGLAAAGVGVAWLAGSLGISTAAAGQVVQAIEAGGWALGLTMGLLGGGLIAAVAASVRWMLVRHGRQVAIA